VQRLNTVGGIAPAGTCTPGVTVAVPYTADYFFWKAKGRRQATTTPTSDLPGQNRYASVALGDVEHERRGRARHRRDRERSAQRARAEGRLLVQ